MAFSQHNTLLVIGAEKRTAVWDYVTGTELYVFQEYHNTWCTTIPHDGRMVATGYHKPEICLRELTKGKSTTLTRHEGNTTMLAFSPTSSSVLASLSKDNMLRLWNIENGTSTHVVNLKGLELVDLMFSPDGESVIAVYDGVRDIRGEKSLLLEAYTVGTGDLIATVGQCRGQHMATSVDGQTVLSYYYVSNSVILSNATENAALHETSAKKPYAAAFCPPNGELLAMTFQSGLIEIRRVDSWGIVWTSKFHDIPRSVSFSPDGKFLAVSDKGVKVQLYDLSADTDGSDNDIIVSSVEFLPAEENLVMLKTGIKRLWCRMEGVIPRDVDCNLIASISYPVERLEFSPDGSHVALRIGRARNPEEVQLWTKRMDRQIRTYNGARNIRFSPDGSHIALEMQDQVRILDQTTSEERVVLKISDRETLESVSLFRFSPDGRVMVWNGDGKLCFADVATGEEWATTYFIKCGNIAFSPDGETVLVDGSDECLSVYQLVHVRTGKKVVAITLEWMFLNFEFHPKGHLLATVDVGTINVWDVRSGVKVHKLSTNLMDDWRITYRMKFSSAGTLLALSWP